MPLNAAMLCWHELSCGWRWHTPKQSAPGTPDCTLPMALLCLCKPSSNRIVVEPLEATHHEVSGAALERPTSQFALLCHMLFLLCCLLCHMLFLLCCRRRSLPKAQRVTGSIAHASYRQGHPQRTSGSSAPGFPDYALGRVHQDSPIMH